MRVLHYVDENKLAWGEPWIQLLKELAHLGVENYVLCQNGGVLLPRLQKENINAIGYKPLAQCAPQLAWGLKRIIEKINPDIIHTRLSAAAKLGGYWGKKIGIPVLETVDKFPKAHYHKDASLLLPCSNAVAEHMKANGFPQEKMAMLPNAIEVVRYGRDEKIRQRMRTQHGLKDDQTVVLGAGRFVDWKGFDDLLRGFAHSKVCEGGGVLWIVGDGPEKENLQRLAKELGLDEAVTFIPFVQDIRPYLWAADVFVQPSWGAEAFGIILIEAMASSLSCIATYNGGMKDIIVNNISGLHVPIHSPEKIASALDQNMNCILRSQLAGNALQRVYDYDVKIVARQTYIVYEKYIQNS